MDKAQQTEKVEQGKSENGAPANSKKSKSRTAGKKTASATDKLEARIAGLEQERDELKDLLLRKAAEFENFKKRSENEHGQRVASANAQLIAQLLPIVDDFERSLATSDEKKDDLESFRGGVDLIFKNLQKVMESYGVSAIEAVGTEFDPEKHEALMQVESEKSDPGMVVEEHRKGYVMNDRVLRHSQVLVSK